ncbi:hypothetical protein M0805_009575 [Coniferiporia weirii]|nr:hypothetical protein M0805_009575 [Coniferiporia weirii]
MSNDGSSFSSQLTSEIILVDSTSTFDLNVLGSKFTPSPSSPFANVFSSDCSDDDAITIVFFHATGFFKETWEPLITRLLALASGSGSESSEKAFGNSNLKIRDIYSIECPNHGESAILNERVLDTYGDTWHTSIYARASHEFLTAGTTRGAKVDFTKRRLVGIGHSMGAAALVMLVNMSPALSFTRLIVIEAAVSRPDISGRHEMSSMLTNLVWMRKDIWANHRAAMKDFKSNPVYSTLDPRIFGLFSRYALRTHPAARFPAPHAFKGITTALTKRQEAACYRDDELVYRALSEYSDLTRKMPVHVIFGDTPDITSVELREVHTDASLGCYPASVSYISDAGHLCVQQAPDKTADAIFEILIKASASGVGNLNGEPITYESKL